MMVDEKKTTLKSEHGGQSFYFCSASCKKTFDADPHKFGHSH
jgi:Cu+-exporting ATPase